MAVLGSVLYTWLAFPVSFCINPIINCLGWWAKNDFVTELFIIFDMLQNIHTRLVKVSYGFGARRGWEKFIVSHLNFLSNLSLIYLKLINLHPQRHCHSEGTHLVSQNFTLSRRHTQSFVTFMRVIAQSASAVSTLNSSDYAKNISNLASFQILLTPDRECRSNVGFVTKIVQICYRKNGKLIFSFRANFFSVK